MAKAGAEERAPMTKEFERLDSEASAARKANRHVNKLLIIVNRNSDITEDRATHSKREHEEQVQQANVSLARSKVSEQAVIHEFARGTNENQRILRRQLQAENSLDRQKAGEEHRDEMIKQGDHNASVVTSLKSQPSNDNSACQTWKQKAPKAIDEHVVLASAKLDDNENISEAHETLKRLQNDRLILLRNELSEQALTARVSAAILKAEGA